MKPSAKPSNRISIDYTLAMDGGSGCGLSDAHLDAEQAAFDRGRRRVLEEARAGVLGFWGLPKAPATGVMSFAQERGDIRDVLVLGIGGSSLGGRAVCDALAPTDSSRQVHFPDNSDPRPLARLLQKLNPSTTLAVAISKSGGTVGNGCTAPGRSRMAGRRSRSKPGADHRSRSRHAA